MSDRAELTRKVYVAYSNTDLTEGRGYRFPIAVCEVEATAIRLAKKCYVMGTDGPVEAVKLLFHNDAWYAPMNAVRVLPPTPEDKHFQEKLNARREAIAKAKAAGLSEADITALWSPI